MIDFESLISPANCERREVVREAVIDDFVARLDRTVLAVDGLNRVFLDLRQGMSMLPDWARPTRDLVQIELTMSRHLQGLNRVRDQLVRWQLG